MSAKDVPWPVLVRIGNGADAVAAAALMNRKAYRKSLESGVPWVVHPATGRVLSWPDDPKIASLAEGPGRFELVLPEGAAPNPFGESAPPDVDPDDRSDMGATGASGGSADSSARAAGVADEAAGASEGAAEEKGAGGTTGASASADIATGSAGVMERLSEVIAERRRTMPEGSYTTLLFEKGLDKIRKKAGEEAVELLLARDRKDVVYEAADLVYHLLVLLEASEVGWSDVIGELDRRHG